jgi:hypothetical protein
MTLCGHRMAGAAMDARKFQKCTFSLVFLHFVRSCVQRHATIHVALQDAAKLGAHRMTG